MSSVILTECDVELLPDFRHLNGLLEYVLSLLLQLSPCQRYAGICINRRLEPVDGGLQNCRRCRVGGRAGTASEVLCPLQRRAS